MIEVTREDREAGWLFKPACYHDGNKQAWMEGVFDKASGCSNTVFSAHRVAAEKAVMDRLRNLPESAVTDFLDRTGYGDHLNFVDVQNIADGLADALGAKQ